MGLDNNTNFANRGHHTEAGQEPTSFPSDSNSFGHDVEAAVPKRSINQQAHAVTSNSAVNTANTKYSIGLLGWYDDCLNQYPLFTKAITSLLIGAFSDVLIQHLENGRLNMQRVVLFAAVSGFYAGPVVHYWYNLLEQLPQIVIPLLTFSSTAAHGSRLVKTLTMLAIDQTLGALILNVGFFYAFELVSMMIIDR